MKILDRVVSTLFGLPPIRQKSTMHLQFHLQLQLTEIQSSGVRVDNQMISQMKALVQHSLSRYGLP